MSTVACYQCGETNCAKELLFPTSEAWQPYCHGCIDKMNETAREINRHELTHFDGRYGLVMWQERDIASGVVNP